MIKEFLEALNSGKEYEFISEHAEQISKQDLRIILMRYIGAVQLQGESSAKGQIVAINIRTHVKTMLSVNTLFE